jgi:multicomponent Na+:H+ antiporter subunit E
MIFYLLLAVPMALVWMIFTTQFNLGGLLVGYGLGLLAVLLIRPAVQPISLRHLPRQLFALVVYVLTLFRDIFLSSIYVARIALAPRLQINPGIIRVPTQDAQEREITAALSAHNITITPGELVVEFEENRVMLVHTLDVAFSTPTAEANQTKRLTMIRQVLEGEPQ